MNGLRLASFGVRGFVGESFDPRVAIDFASAFGTFVEGRRILVGRDTRYSSDMLHEATVSALLSCGCEVIDFGICPTPVLQFSVCKWQAEGAISISGGHNTMGWNALTLIGSDGAYLNPQGGQIVLDVYHAGDFERRRWSGVGELIPESNYTESYFDALQSFLDVDAIRAANFKVLIDPVGGAGCSFLKPFAERFGFELVPVNADPSGYLAREPEPRPRTARHLGSIIGHVDGSIGFALNSDCSRLSIVTEAGEPASEEYTMPLIADYVLRKTPGTLVTNTCTTRSVDQVAAQAGVNVVKTPVGQAHIVARLIDEQGVIGGEGSGSVVVPSFSRACDAFLMMGLILESMATSGQPISKILEGLPRFQIVKRAYECRSDDAYHALERLRQEVNMRVKPEQISVIDGVRVDWPEAWVHARTSRTQQRIRIISEAETMAMAEQRNDEIRRLLDL